MQANIWFNVSALFILIILMALYYTKFRVPFRKYSIFLGLVWLALISTVSSICNNTLPGIVPNWILRISNMTYFVFHGLIPPTLLLYVYSLTDYNLRHWQRLIPWMIPSLFSTLLVLTSWYADTLFWLDEGGIYHRGPLMILLYLVTALNFIGIGYNLARDWKMIPPQESSSVLVFILLSTGAVVIQLFWPQMLVENFASAICMMISQLTVQNPERILDGSTGMLNKQGFSDLLTPRFERQRPFPVGFLMVDNYHELEKIYGFNRLESRMVILTDYLRQHTGCLFSRMDNRLFCFVPENFQNSSAWAALLRDLEEEAVTSRLKQEQIGIRIQLKIGVANCPQDADSFGSMMEMIDQAAKIPMDRNRDVLRLTGGDMMKLHRRKQIDTLVRNAVMENSLSLVYQPIYSVKEQCFVGAEALLRMNTEKLGFISPGEFIPIAEGNGAILQMTQFVVENVCRFIRLADLPPRVMRRVHINLSAIDCAQSELAAKILEGIHRNGVNPSLVSAEVTETAFSSMSDSMLTNLTDLSRAGIAIMLDDYGTGYSNLKRLYSMPLDVVKLDRSLIADIRSSNDARIVLENTILMMKRLNKIVLVEGVETKEQADYVISHGADYIQGYYYARPMDAAHLEKLFREQMEKKET